MMKKKLKKRYLLFLAPLLLFLVAAIGILTHKEPNLDGVYYLTVAHQDTHTVSLDKSVKIVIEGRDVEFSQDGKTKVMSLSRKEKTLTDSKITYYYTHVKGVISLSEKLGKKKYVNTSYVSKDSDMFDEYEKGKVKYTGDRSAFANSD